MVDPHQFAGEGPHRHSQHFQKKTSQENPRHTQARRAAEIAYGVDNKKKKNYNFTTSLS